MTVIKLVTGDGYADGHGLTDKILYNVNVSWQELEKHFDEGTQILDFDLTEQCEKYEDNLLTQDAYDKLKEHFPDSEMVKAIKEYTDWEGLHLDPEQFAELYMMIAQLGYPELEYSIFEFSEIDIGGYGLFR